MANEAQTLTIIIKLRDLASKQLKSIGRGVQKFRAGLSIASGAVLGMQGAIATIGLGLLSRSFISAASAAESYSIRLKVLTGSAKEGNRLFKEMADFAGGVAFEYAEIMGAATSLTGVLEGGSKEVGKWMPLIADLAATSGLGIQQTTSQIIRMYSVGAASADLFRDNGILAMLGFQSGVSVSAKKTREQLIKAFEDPASKFRGAAAELSTTWTGLMSMMSDAWFQFRTDVMDAGVFDFIKAGPSLFLDYMRQLKAEGKQATFAKDMADDIIKALVFIAKAIAFAADVWRGWTMIWDSLKINFGELVSFVFDGLSKILEHTAIVYKALGTIVPALAKVGEHAKVASINLKESAKFWSEIAAEASKSLQVTAKEESALSRVTKVLDAMKRKAEEFRKAREKSLETEGRGVTRAKPVASPAAVAKAELIELKAKNATKLQMEKILFDKLKISAQDYADTRLNISKEIYAKEQVMLRAQAEATSQVDKKRQIMAQLVALEEKHTRDIVSIEQERFSNETAANERIVAQKKSINKLLLELRLKVSDPSSYNAERDAMARKHEEEVSALVANKATLAQIEEAHRLQQLERDKLSADKRKEVYNGFVNVIGQGLNMLTEYYKDQAEKSGDTQSKAAKKYKKIAIATAIMDTMQSAVKAYNSLAGIDIVGPVLGAAAAAMAVAMGMQRVAMIRNQRFASGGLIQGQSPHSRADNIPINATAGEFMQPIPAVNYYGRGVMEAMRSKMIPRELFEGFSRPDSVSITRKGYASGGLVSSAGGSKTSERATKDTQPINITNIIDPQMMGQYTASKPGQRNVMNVLSQNQFQLKQIVLGE